MTRTKNELQEIILVAYLGVDADPVEISWQLLGDVRLASRRKSNERNDVRGGRRGGLLPHRPFAHGHGQVEAEFAVLVEVAEKQRCKYFNKRDFKWSKHNIYIQFQSTFFFPIKQSRKFFQLNWERIIVIFFRETNDKRRNRIDRLRHD